MSAFQREVRYIVTKIKTGKQVTCVVVEEDWPEYETVWKMLQDRIEGKPNELDQLRARVAELERKLTEANAHVVMEFWGDSPPTFHQGYKPHELADMVTAERMASLINLVTELRERAEQAERRIAESQRQDTFEWPKLDKPALVGAARFGIGVSSKLVVDAAKRHHEYEVTPEKEAERIKRENELFHIVPLTVEEAVKAERERLLSEIGNMKNQPGEVIAANIRARSQISLK